MTTVHQPYDTRVFHKECSSLQKAGYDVSLIAPMRKDEVREDTGIHLIPMKKRKNRLLRMTLSTLQAYRLAKRLDADCYHFHDPELLPVGWLLKKKRNIVIYDVHEDYVTSIYQKEYIAKPIRKWIASLYGFIEKQFSRRMDLCLAEKYYKEKHPSGKCILNYPALNEKLLHHQVDLEPAGEKLLYTGNVSIERGAIIQSRLPQIDGNISVHFIGKCPKHLAEKMYATAGEHKRNLIIEGIDRFIEREQIDDNYVNRKWLAGIALFPPTEHYRKKELTKFFEYMSAGIPIICSNFPVWESFIETYACGITVDPYNDEEVKNAIDYLRQHPTEARQMGINGKRAVLEELNWGTEEEKLIRWYESLLTRIAG
jgi:glycosyltransferase involved in cell wall biosynthesis